MVTTFSRRLKLGGWSPGSNESAIGLIGTLTTTQGDEPELTWRWGLGGVPSCLARVEALVDEIKAPGPHHHLPICGAATSDYVLIAYERGRNIWRARRGDLQGGVVAFMDRPLDLDQGLFFLRFIASPNGLWVIAFCESGFAAFHDGELTMSERYDEYLWTPTAVTNEHIALSHYAEGSREIRLLT